MGAFEMRVMTGAAERQRRFGVQGQCGFKGCAARRLDLSWLVGSACGYHDEALRRCFHQADPQERHEERRAGPAKVAGEIRSRREFRVIHRFGGGGAVSTWGG